MSGADRFGAPIFIIGSPRSGTTLLRLMLASHPEIVIPPECGFAVFLEPRFTPWHPERASAFAEAVASSRKFDTWGVPADALRAHVVARAPSTYADACAAVYVLYGRTTRDHFSRWGDKNNFHVHHIPDLVRLWPEACFVHIVRDGRDVACSYLDLAARRFTSAYAPDLPTEIDAIAAQWSDNVLGASEALSGVPRTVTVHYEGLVRDPEPVLRAICLAVGEDYSDEMLQYPGKAHEPYETLAWKEKTRLPPQADRAGRWRDVLAAGQVAAFEAVAGAALSLHGYALEGTR